MEGANDARLSRIRTVLRRALRYLAAARRTSSDAESVLHELELELIRAWGILCVEDEQLGVDVDEEHLLEVMDEARDNAQGIPS